MDTTEFLFPYKDNQYLFTGSFPPTIVGRLKTYGYITYASTLYSYPTSPVSKTKPSLSTLSKTTLTTNKKSTLYIQKKLLSTKTKKTTLYKKCLPLAPTTTQSTKAKPTQDSALTRGIPTLISKRRVRNSSRTKSSADIPKHPVRGSVSISKTDGKAHLRRSRTDGTSTRQQSLPTR